MFGIAKGVLICDATKLSSGKIEVIQVVMALGIHLYPSRTEQLSPMAPMVLRKSGRVGSRRFLKKEKLPTGSFSFLYSIFITRREFSFRQGKSRLPGGKMSAF